MMQPQRRQHGFTLIELMVAIGVTLVMMLLVSRIFVDTTRAVSRGVAVGETVAAGRSAGEQLERDFNYMVGPRGWSGDTMTGPEFGGVLIILHRALPDVQMSKPHGPDFGEGSWVPNDPNDPYRTGSIIRRPVRTDQLSFIRARRDEMPTTPARADTFTNWDPGPLPRHLLVRYGHLKRTDPDGANEMLGTDEAFLGNIGSVDVDATEWILGRQALFLGEPDANPSEWPSHPPYAAEAPWPMAGVTGDGPNEFLFMGVTDYATFSLDDVDYGSIVGESASGGAFSNQRLGADLTPEEYHERAVVFYTYDDDVSTRLRVNPRPEPGAWQSWQIAQQHAFFMDHVSDFIVEFAADIYRNDNGQFEPDGQVDVDGEGNIRWYGYWFNEPPNDPNDPIPSQNPNQRRVMFADGSVGTATYDPNFPVVYEPPDDWEPYYITSNPNDPLNGTFVWRHDRDDPHSDDGASTANDQCDTYCNWPYLLRIRFRMHDKRGELMQGENQHGMWFEQTVRVERP